MGLLLRPEAPPSTAMRLCPAGPESGEVCVFRLIEGQGQFPRTGQAKTIHCFGLGRGTDPDQSDCVKESEKPPSVGIQPGRIATNLDTAMPMQAKVRGPLLRAASVLHRSIDRHFGIRPLNVSSEGRRPILRPPSPELLVKGEISCERVTWQDQEACRKALSPAGQSQGPVFGIGILAQPSAHEPPSFTGPIQLFQFKSRIQRHIRLAIAAGSQDGPRGWRA